MSFHEEGFSIRLLPSPKKCTVDFVECRFVCWFGVFFIGFLVTLRSNRTSRSFILSFVSKCCILTAIARLQLFY